MALPHLSYERLNELLDGTLARAAVRSISIEPFPEDAGQLSEIARIHLEPRPLDDQLPATLIVKVGRDHPDTIRINELLGTARRESGFYLHVAPALPRALAPSCFAVADVRAKADLLLLEDLGGLRFPPTGAHLSAEDVAALIDCAAELHGSTWMAPDTQVKQDGLPSPTTLDWMPGAYADSLPHFQTVFADQLSDSVRHAAQSICRSYEAVIDALDEWTGRFGSCACHGDLRLANVAFDDDAPPGARTRLIDWGMAMRAPGPMELAYLLANAVPPHELAEREGAWMERYRIALEKAGGPALRIEDLREAYDLGHLWYTIYLVVGSATTPVDLPASQRFFLSHIERQFSAVLRLGHPLSRSSSGMSSDSTNRRNPR